MFYVIRKKNTVFFGKGKYYFLEQNPTGLPFFPLKVKIIKVKFRSLSQKEFQPLSYILIKKKE